MTRSTNISSAVPMMTRSRQSFRSMISVEGFAWLGGRQESETSQRRHWWFRSYTSDVHDEKLQTLPAELFKLRQNLLCIAGENHGRFPPDIQIAYVLHMSEFKLAKMREQLKAAGLDAEDG